MAHGLDGSHDLSLEAILREIGRDAPPPSYPNAFYNREGDGIQAAIREHGMTHTRWMPGGLVELVIEDSTREIVGFNLWGVKHLMREAEEGHQFYVRRDEERARALKRAKRRAWWRGFWEGVGSLLVLWPTETSRQRRRRR